MLCHVQLRTKFQIAFVKSDHSSAAADEATSHQGARPVGRQRVVADASAPPLSKSASVGLSETPVISCALHPNKFHASAPLLQSGATGFDAGNGEELSNSQSA